MKSSWIIRLIGVSIHKGKCETIFPRCFAAPTSTTGTHWVKVKLFGLVPFGKQARVLSLPAATTDFAMQDAGSRVDDRIVQRAGFRSDGAVSSNFRCCTLKLYNDAPNKSPTPAVSPIASAPQKATRKAALATGAPPAYAPNPPSRASKTIEPQTSERMNQDLANHFLAPGCQLRYCYPVVHRWRHNSIGRFQQR